jgi:hypothetical protein
VEIPQYRRRRNASGVFEELERKARFLALSRQKCAQIENKFLTFYLFLFPSLLTANSSLLIVNFFSFFLFPSSLLP